MLPNYRCIGGLPARLAARRTWNRVRVAGQSALSVGTRNCQELLGERPLFLTPLDNQVFVRGKGATNRKDEGVEYICILVSHCVFLHLW